MVQNTESNVRMNGSLLNTNYIILHLSVFFFLMPP